MVVVVVRMEQDPLSVWQSNRAKVLVSAAAGEPLSGSECELGGPRHT